MASKIPNSLNYSAYRNTKHTPPRPKTVAISCGWQEVPDESYFRASSARGHVPGVAAPSPFAFASMALGSSEYASLLAARLRVRRLPSRREHHGRGSIAGSLPASVSDTLVANWGRRRSKWRAPQ